MDMSTYQSKAFGYAKFETNDYPFMALAEEVGEVSGKIAKVVRKHGCTADQAIASAAAPTCPPEQELREDLRKELGDVLWQLAACCTELGFAMGDVAELNLEKLADRNSRGVIVGEGDHR